jgi:hypothetical protein
MSATPTEGDCHVALACHVDKGKYGDTSIDGLNAVLVVESHGPMGAGNLTYGLYVDDRANARQEEALSAIFSGAGGGPLSGFAPLFGKFLGTKKAKIDYKAENSSRSASIPGVLSMSASALPSMAEGGVTWAETGHPFNPKRLALAVAGQGSTYSDHGMKWDNSGRNGHFAEINWSN